jgi:hypothetical protein
VASVNGTNEPVTKRSPTSAPSAARRRDHGNGVAERRDLHRGDKHAVAGASWSPHASGSASAVAQAMIRSNGAAGA